MEKTRRKRHTPDRSRTRFLDTKEKREILELLAQYKYLRSSAIHTLLPHRGIQGLRGTLRALFDQGLLTKPSEQLRGYNNLYCPDIYMLTPKGEKFLVERGNNPRTITRLYRKETDGPIQNFAHAMMICDTLASIHAGANEAGIKFIPWSKIIERSDHPNPTKLPCHLNHDGQSLNTFVVPDGLFGLTYPNGQTSFFALECENWNPIEPKSLKRASFLKKFLAYRDVSKTGVYKYQLNIPNMRVLVISPSDAKIGNQIDLGTKFITSTNLFLFHKIPVQERLFKAPEPFPELLTSKWRRIGLDPVALFECDSINSNDTNRNKRKTTL